MPVSWHTILGVVVIILWLTLLNSVLPTGHKDRDLTVEEILSRDLKAKCHSGGAEEGNGGQQQDLEEEEEGPTKEELEKLFSEDTIEDLIDAARNDEGPR